MTQFEFDQLSIIVGAWEIRAEMTDDETERRMCLSHAEELRQFLRHVDTLPGDEPDEPERLPPMRWPSDRPTITRPVGT
mgnify:CR=1 FL=1